MEDFEYQGKRPDQYESSAKTGAICFIGVVVLVIAYLVSLLWT